MLTGKKLMILGGTVYACELVRICRKKGIISIVIDYNKDSPAKKIADISYLVDIKDINTIVKIGKEEKVDGVIFTVLDFIFDYYVEICSQLKVPCYGTKEQFRLMQNKDEFKNTCIKYNVDVIPEYSVDCINDSDILVDFPVIVKPVDASASRGISVCNNPEELMNGINKAYEYAEINKRRRGLIIEKFMNCKDFIVNYIIVEGKIFAGLTGDRFVSCEDKRKGSVTSAVIYPSKYTKLYFNFAHQKICNMIKHLGIKNGVLFIQMFIDNGKFRCYDPGFRTGGAEVFKFSECIHGYNQLEMMLNYALTNKMNPTVQIQENDCYLNGKTACCITVLLKKGQIKSIIGMDFVSQIKGVIGITQFFHEGDIVKESASLAQTLARIHIVTEDETQLANVLFEIKKYIKVYDINGNDMLIDIFNPKLLKNR